MYDLYPIVLPRTHIYIYYNEKYFWKIYFPSVGIFTVGGGGCYTARFVYYNYNIFKVGTI